MYWSSVSSSQDLCMHVQHRSLAVAGIYHNLLIYLSIVCPLSIRNYSYNAWYLIKTVLIFFTLTPEAKLILVDSVQKFSMQRGTGTSLLHSVLDDYLPSITTSYPLGLPPL